MLQALTGMKTGIAPGPSDVSLELIAACMGIGIHVMRVVHGWNASRMGSKYCGANLQGEG